MGDLGGGSIELLPCSKASGAASTTTLRMVGMVFRMNCCRVILLSMSAR